MPLVVANSASGCRWFDNRPAFVNIQTVWTLVPGMSDGALTLQTIEAGDAKTAEELLPLVYEQLRQLASHRMAKESEGHTLQPTALVHEVWLRFAADRQKKFQNRAHFFSVAAEAMRRILIDRARQKRALRHGGSQQRVAYEEMKLASPENDDQLLAINDALQKLAAEHPVEAQVVKLRYFVGMTHDEVAAALDIAPRTAKYYWTHARAWLYHAIAGSVGQTTPEPSRPLKDGRDALRSGSR